MSLVLTINPGSTSTKVAVFRDEAVLHQISLEHTEEELKRYEEISDQKPMREAAIKAWLAEVGVALTDLNVIVTRGGMVRPIPTGTYRVTDLMVEDLRQGYTGVHASNLAAQIGSDLAKEAGIQAYIVDPVSSDEMEDVARISGLPDIVRRSSSHYLNMKSVLRRVCQERAFDITKDNFVVAHLGGGITVAPQRAGQVIDTNNANEGGPFSPERAGSLPVADLVKMAYSGEYTEKELTRRIIGKGGLSAYLGTNDARKVEAMIEAGDKKAELIYRAMAYQIAKEIGAMSTALAGKVRAIIITGGLAYSKMLMDWIQDHVSFIAEVIVEPGEDEMKALAEAGLRILRNEETAKDYDEEAKKHD